MYIIPLPLRIAVITLSPFAPLQRNLSVLVKLQAVSSPLHPDRGLKHIQKARNSSSSAPVTSLFALCLVLWTSTCMCLNALFNRASTHILRAFYFAHIDITTDRSSNISCACARGRPSGLSALPSQSASDAIIVVTAASQSANLLSMTVNIASEMHFNALRSPTQPCLTACCS